MANKANIQDDFGDKGDGTYGEIKVNQRSSTQTESYPIKTLGVAFPDCWKHWKFLVNN